MDYSKSGNPGAAKGAPKFDGQDRHGPPKHAHGKPTDKAALLARMKAAAEARAKDK